MKKAQVCLIESDTLTLYKLKSSFASSVSNYLSFTSNKEIMMALTPCWLIVKGLSDNENSVRI